jgi:hypothetical protein
VNIGVIGAVNLALFKNVFGMFFWSDDFHHLLVNSNTWFFDAFTYKLQAWANPNLYRPTTNLFYQFNLRFFGLYAIYWHVEMLIIIILSSIFLYKTIHLLFDNRKVALCSALFFSVLPLRVEPASWLANVCDTLLIFFGVLCIYFLVKFLKRGAGINLKLSLAAFLLALLSKEPAIALLPILFLIIVSYLGISRMAIFHYARYLGIGSAYVLLRYAYSNFMTSHGYTAPRYSNPTISTYSPENIKAKSMEFLPRLFDLPTVLTTRQTGIILIASGCAVFLLGALIVYRERRSVVTQGFFIGMALVFLPILVSLNTPYLADRYLYFSSVGLAIVLAAGLMFFSRVSRIIFGGLLGVTLVVSSFYFVVTTKYMDVLRDESNLSYRFVQAERAYPNVDIDLLLVPYLYQQKVFGLWDVSGLIVSEPSHPNSIAQVFYHSDRQINTLSRVYITDMNYVINATRERIEIINGFSYDDQPGILNEYRGKDLFYFDGEKIRPLDRLS